MTWLRPRGRKPVVTQYERRLCKELEKENIPFKTQVKITLKCGRSYLVDIVLFHKIIIEVGYIGPKDYQEDADLRNEGYAVLRFKNYEIRKYLKDVMKTIKKDLRRASNE